jgi:uncharacterized protein (DUF1778 family)
MSNPLTKSDSKKKMVSKAGKVSVGVENVNRKSKPGAYSRFDARLPLETKQQLERAAAIKGFKSLSEFIIHFSSEAALSIIERNNQILASEKDQAIFFDTLLNPPDPNEALIKTAELYKAQIEAK